MSTNNNQPNTEPSVSEMHDIMGFNDKYSSQHSDNGTEVIDVEAIEEVDRFNHQESNPEKNITKVGLRKNGTAKLTLVSVAGLVAFFAATSFYQSQMPKEKVVEAPKPKDPLSEQVETAQSDVTKAQQSESESKSELALSKQKDALEQANSNKNSDQANKSSADPNTKVVTTPAPSVPIDPPVKPSRASGFVPPLAIPNNGSAKVATAAPFVPPTSKNNISIPPAGIQPLQTVSAPKLATTSVGTLINKNAVGSAPVTSVPSGGSIKTIASLAPLAIAKAPGITNTPSVKAPIQEIARIEPVRTSSRKRFSEDSEPLPRLPIARAPGISADTEVASSTLPPPLYPVAHQSGTPNTIAPAVINSAPSLTDFLKTSAAADTPTAPIGQPQLMAMNKDQSKEKQAVKDPKAVLQAFPVPTNTLLNAPTLASAVTQSNKSTNLIASNGSRKSYKNSYSGLVSPNSLLTDITNPPPFGVSIAENASTAIASAIPAAQTIRPALAQAPGSNSARPAYAHTKMLMAGLPDVSMSLGNIEQISGNQQINQVNKAQVVTQNNPILNQPATPTTVLGTPVNPVSPTALPVPQAIAPSSAIAASILTGTSAKGTTLTPILWGSDSANGAKFVAKLEEPLLANNKREALPAGTQLIVVARPSSSSNGSSLVEVDVVGVIVQGREYATPPGAIVIHDENNGLLVGEDYFKREDQIASRDYMTVLGGALNTLGQVLNRPSGSFSSNSSGFGSSSTNVINNREPNVFGALLEGGFKDIPGIWNQRNQQALAQLANQPKVYQIPKGRTIRVFVNQSIIF